MTQTIKPGHLARAMQRLRPARPPKHRALVDANGLTDADYADAAARIARAEAARRDPLLDVAFGAGTVQDNGQAVTR